LEEDEDGLPIGRERESFAYGEEEAHGHTQSFHAVHVGRDPFGRFLAENTRHLRGKG